MKEGNMKIKITIEQGDNSNMVRIGHPTLPKVELDFDGDVKEYELFLPHIIKLMQPFAIMS